MAVFSQDADRQGERLEYVANVVIEHPTNAQLGYARAVSPIAEVNTRSEGAAETGGTKEQTATNPVAAPEAPDHPPVVDHMRPQREVRLKRKAKEQATRESRRSPASGDEGDRATTPCPPPSSTNNSGKRKKSVRDVGRDEPRQEGGDISRGTATSAPTSGTYRWMTRQSTAGPSDRSRNEALPHDLRREPPQLLEDDSITGAFGPAPPPFNQMGASPHIQARDEGNAPAFLHPSAPFAQGPYHSDYVQHTQMENGAGLYGANWREPGWMNDGNVSGELPDYIHPDDIVWDWIIHT